MVDWVCFVSDVVRCGDVSGAAANLCAPFYPYWMGACSFGDNCGDFSGVWRKCFKQSGRFSGMDMSTYPSV